MLSGKFRIEAGRRARQLVHADLAIGDAQDAVGRRPVRTAGECNERVELWCRDVRARACQAKPVSRMGTRTTLSATTGRDNGASARALAGAREEDDQIRRVDDRGAERSTVPTKFARSERRRTVLDDGRDEDQHDGGRASTTDAAVSPMKRLRRGLFEVQPTRTLRPASGRTTAGWPACATAAKSTAAQARRPVARSQRRRTTAPWPRGTATGRAARPPP